MEADNWLKEYWIFGLEVPLALETACLEEYFGCKEAELPVTKLGISRKLKESFRKFMSEKRDLEIPAGANRGRFLIDLWKTDKLSKFGLPSVEKSEGWGAFYGI